MSRLPRPCVCLVTARQLLSPDARTVSVEIAALEGWLDDAVAARVDVIQIRERDLDAAMLRALVQRVSRRAREGATRVLVNDRADVAVTAGADGVHLRADGAAVERVRRLGPAGWIVGRAVHTTSEASAAGGADYVLFGTVFSGGSKPEPVTVAGLDSLRDAIAASPVPVMAIGGIDPGRAAMCAGAGAAGVAAISIFLPEGRAPGAMGVARAMKALRHALRETTPQ